MIIVAVATIAALVAVVLVVLVAGDPEEDERRRRRVFVADVLQRADAAGDREDLRERAARWRELGDDGPGDGRGVA